LYPEVESARLAGRALLVLSVVSLLAAAVVLGYKGVDARITTFILIVLAVIEALIVQRAMERPRVLDRKIRSFDAWCGGAERAVRGSSGVYYCERSDVILCFDPLLDRVHVVRGATSGLIRDPGRPDYRCTLRVKGYESEVGDARVFFGTLYAPQPGSPGKLVKVDGVEAYAFIDCGDPAGVADKLLRLVERLGGERATGS
jgi:hypothetical protein